MISAEARFHFGTIWLSAPTFTGWVCVSGDFCEMEMAGIHFNDIPPATADFECIFLHLSWIVNDCRDFGPHYVHILPQYQSALFNDIKVVAFLRQRIKH
jgi:hypothetical protein